VRIGVLVNPNYPAGVAEGGELQARGQALGLTVHVLNAAAEGDFAAVFAVAAAQHIEALLVAGDPLLIDLRDPLVRTAAPYAIPAIYVTRDFVEAGGLMSYGASIGDSYRKAGAYAGQILKGAKPADLPVLQPTRFELVINLKTAKALGLAVPPTLLALADEVIE
jgi:putative tryptophan/tyrosine transport system substrate-binding protein